MTTAQKKPTKKAAAALAVALAAGVAGGRASAPTPDPIVQADPLGGWRYADLPHSACTTIEGAGIGRVSVRLDVLTLNGTRVAVPEHRAEGPQWWLCATTPEVDRSAAPAGSDTCYARQPDGQIEVTVSGRKLAPRTTFPDCILEAFRLAVEANPLTSSKESSKL